MRSILALFALVALILTPLAPAIASIRASQPCATMSHHQQAPDHNAAAHECCTPALPTLPDRVAVVTAPTRMALADPVAVEPTLILSNRPDIELRPPRTI